MSKKRLHLSTIVWLVLMGIVICVIPTQETYAAAHQAYATTNPAPNVIPGLREWHGGTGTFLLSKTSHIVVDSSYTKQLDETASVFQNDLQIVTGLQLSVTHASSDASGDFFLTLNTSNSGIGQEGYLFQVSSDVVIRANSSRGILYGTRTALQILLQDKTNSHIPQGNARDYPKYRERGFMLDVGRKFVSLSFLKDYVKFMAWYKMNDFHLHLNDNPAFRLKSTNSAFSGLAAPDGSYPKQDMRELQDLAWQYAVTITPEIDSPAHDGAITKFRPDLALSSNKNFLDLQNSKTIPFMKSLWDEFTPWFDTNQFHIGADEYGV